MSETSQSFRHEAEQTFRSTSKFRFPGMDDDLLDSSANQNEVEPLTDKCYGLVPKEQTAPKLKFIFKNGNRCTVPYAYLLRTEYDTEGILTIFTSEKEIVIEGRGLDYLEDLLYENKVVWIKESNLSFDTNQNRVFVKVIEVRDRK